jgi:tetratricopeptide (TPR) repeat protein
MSQLAGPRSANIYGDLPVGEVIPGSRYRVLTKLGEGGMGVVYSAVHVDLDKRVALKVLRPDPARDPKAVDRFRREARTASKIGSPYITDVTDFGELPDGRLFFVMEYLDGVSIGRLLRAGEKFPPERAIPILRQMAKALGATHERGVIHLDVKPDNVVLMQKGNRHDAVKVVDFGIAGLLSESQGGQKVISGTAAYVAPERAIGGAYDHRSDIYSLGIVAYELLAGGPPFLGRDYMTTLTMQVKDKPLPFARSAPHARIPPALEKVIFQLLEKDPASRPQSMTEVEARLCEAQIAAGLRTEWDDLELPLVAEEWRRTLAEGMPTPWSKKRKLIVGGALGVAFAGLCVGVYFGAIRGPRVVVREVRFAATQTDEVPQVAASLVKAVEAARRNQYVRPEGASAFDHLNNADDEARRLSRRSRGVELLRDAYASALASIGDELLGAKLYDLAALKFEEAALFRPDDASLRKRADEAQALAGDTRKGKPRLMIRATAANGVRTLPPVEDQRKTLASDAFAAARAGQVGDAEGVLVQLRALDPQGGEVRRLAVALRTAARDRWSDGRAGEAQPLYQLLSEVDPTDHEAKQRAQGAPDQATRQPSPPEPAPPESHARAVHRAQAVPDDANEVPRDRATSRAATRQGQQAMAGAHLADAEEAFTRAVRADPLNAQAIAGLAAVAFERARYAEALDYARRATRLAPKAPAYELLLGDAYYKLLRLDDAAATYQKAKQLGASPSEVDGRIAKVQAKLR